MAHVRMPAKGADFEMPPTGAHIAVCYRVIDLGTQETTYLGQKKLTHQILISWEMPDELMTDGRPFSIHKRYTYSSSPKANLRKDLESWRGKSYSDDQAREGVPLHKLVGHHALISVEHKRSAKGRTYGNIKAIAPLPKAMHGPGVDGYKRAEFWAARKEQYAEEARKWAAQMLAKQDGPPLDEDQAQDDDGEMPF